VEKELDVSQRRACQVVEQPRSTQRYEKRDDAEEREIVKRLQALSRKHPRWGYRFMTRLLRQEGLRINRKRVQRLWREAGLKVPVKVTRKRRLGGSANACFRRRAERPNHVWSYDFVMDQTSDGRRLKILAVVDEYTRECLALEVERCMEAEDVVEVLRKIVAMRGAPESIRSDNGGEFIARAVREYLKANGAQTLYIDPGAPWENAYSETFNSRLGDELLKREVFDTLAEAKVLVAKYRREYNEERPHSSLDYATPAEYAARCALSLKLGSSRLAPAAPPPSSPAELVSATDADSDGAAGLVGSPVLEKLS
jgi:transposase InsO family protein